jgi:hypothetical protein
MSKTEARAPSAPETKAAIEALVNTTLGDLLLSGSLKHPEDAGHIIAEAIAAAKDPCQPEPHPQTIGETSAEDNAGAKTLVNTTLGDLLLDGMLKHPENAAHIIAEAITEAIGIAKDTAVESEPHPKPAAEINGASKAAPKPEANPESPAAADLATIAKGAPAAETRAEAKPEAGANFTAEAEPDAVARAKPEAGAVPMSETKIGLETLENTKFGDLLLAGVLKDPEEAAHIIAGAITDVEAPAPKVPT